MFPVLATVLAGHCWRHTIERMVSSQEVQVSMTSSLSFCAVPGSSCFFSALISSSMPMSSVDPHPQSLLPARSTIAWRLPHTQIQGCPSTWSSSPKNGSTRPAPLAQRWLDGRSLPGGDRVGRLSRRARRSLRAGRGLHSRRRRSRGLPIGTARWIRAWTL